MIPTANPPAQQQQRRQQQQQQKQVIKLPLRLQSIHTLQVTFMRRRTRHHERNPYTHSPVFDFHLETIRKYTDLEYFSPKE
ncbi:hypothetical protein E2C01_037465 [Portunus trituberculatus]|uniref:Uncharacterized protein n=1 Tax=Portunus trituberculatus TaxID=210409 RepID=A0A5B7F9F3_PORTR|nr:hypothetical protein [Portunus trituberculatus]